MSAGWWVAAVALTPAAARPYIGGSQDDSVLGLTLGYNGLGRLTGDETGSVGGGGAGGGWGATGLLRMFDSEFGGQASHLVPGALVLLAVALWRSRRAPRTDPGRAGLLLWGGWLLLTGLVLSLAKGIIHPYYAVALAPATGAVVGIGAVQLWRARHAPGARLGLAVALFATVEWTVRLLDRTPAWHPWLRPTVLALGAAVVLGLLVAGPLTRALRTALVAGGLVAALVTPAAASVATAAVPHTGALPSASPAVQGGFPGGRALGRPGGPGGAGGGLGSLLDAGTVSADLVAALRQDAGSYTWVAAAVGSNSAAGPQLASGEPVMAIGGFNGTDPSPTLTAFQALVAQGRVHWFLAGSGGGPGRATTTTTTTAAQITAWVTSTFTAQTIGGATVYDLTAPAG